MSDPSAIADAAGYASYLSLDHKWELLENPDVESRLEALIGWTRDHLAEAEITDKIGEDVREGMEKSQREFLLRQQLTAIRKELGEGEARKSVVEGKSVSVRVDLGGGGIMRKNNTK